MTTFNPISGTQTSAAPRTNALVPDASRTTPDQTDFLRLLTVQLAQQDPLNPQDSQAFVEQLATFSSLEQLTNIKDGLDSLSMAQASVVSATAVDFAGRMATIEGNSFDLQAGTPAKLGAYLPEAGHMRATIKDGAGNTIKEIVLSNQSGGLVHFDWDGTTNDGSEAPPARYTLSVEITTPTSETPVTATPLLRAPVDSITFDKGYAELRILGRRYPLGAVLEIGA